MQAKINCLTSQFNQADQQYDNVVNQVSAAKSRLAYRDKQLAGEEATYKTAQQKFLQIADATYEDSGETSLAGLLTWQPRHVLGEASIVLS